MIMVRRRQSDGSLGPLEPAFPEVPEQMDETVLIMLQAMAGMQEQIDMLTAKHDEKGGAE
ncbi:hypothetical protein CSV67_02805 [Sporosarcina sp. P2]|uniref:hypothetical protein n=1 Tax=Sporosarcina sp. P2 TaxID=2048251 RepID=UPI000C167049|nr:hypothetical protein [Sporosarcina sp. P2]PID03589.1 hypothetical protein CSV67_02805 [Sporosarcina sp. P2]